jgi:long-chain acyl-CoA synthetase
MQTIDWALRFARSRFPDREAIVDGEVRYTFSQLEGRVNCLGQALLALGVSPGDRVAVLMNNSHRFFELHYAIPGIGALIVPINARLAVAEMAHILRDSGSSVLIIDEYNKHQLEALTPLIDKTISAPGEYERMVANAEPVPLPGPRSENDLTGLYYTGGTTGPGKGVMMSHRNQIANAFHGTLDFMRDDAGTFMLAFPLFHVGAIAGIYASLWSGTRTVFVPVMDPAVLLETIEKEQVTYTSLVPTLINFLVSHPNAATTDFSSLKTVIHGAAPISPELCKKAAEIFDCTLIQAYGMTECLGIAATFHDEQDHLHSDRIKAAGRPVAGVEAQVRRPDGSVCKVREVGEITLRGPNIMQGYWNRPDLTAEVLKDGWYWSGDLGFEDEEGYIYLVDRSKDMIVSGGENVFSVEVEQVLDQHPAVFEVAVIGIPSDKWGEQVHAIIVLRPDQAASETELIGFCRDFIAGYKCPKSISFIEDELPKSGVGKILKRQLREPYWRDAGRDVG